MSAGAALPSVSPLPPLPALLAEAKRCRGEGRAAEAERLLLEIIRRAPSSGLARLELGNLWKAQGKFRPALAQLSAAVRHAPREAAAWLNCGVAHLELGEADQAAACFREALAIEPARAEGHNILGHALLVQGKSTLAATHFREALRLRPGYAAAHDNLGRTCKLQGRAAEALEHHRAALAAAPKATTHSNLLYTLNLLELPPDEIFAEHKKWAALYAPPTPRVGPKALKASAPHSAPRRLRIGYVSPDLCAHAVAFFFEPVLENHDRDRFEVFCYSDVKVPDAVTARLRAKSEHWRECGALTDAALLNAIRADGIDVLVDLAGHTAGNRLAVFAHRAAPAQFTWLGYPNTTGLPAMDFRITDPVADPAGTDRWHTEKLIRLPDCFSCFRPAPESPPVAPPPALAADGRITFGCFNHIAKLNEPLLARWAEALRTVPHSRLLLKSRGMGDAATVRSIRRQFDGAGVAEDRVCFLSAELGVAEHLALYARVDIALDPFPYTGATTTCEALWMGVPVVTLAGQTHVSRVGASMLAAVGDADTVAASSADYIRIACELARSPAALEERRKTQRQRMAASPLCDGRRFTRELEAAWSAGWAEKLAGVGCLLADGKE